MTQLLPVQFRGVDQGADPKVQPPGTLVRAVNCAMDKGRRLLKRAGTTGLPRTLIDGGSVATGSRLLTRGGDLAIHDGTHVQAYSTDLQKWQTVARPPHLQVTRRTLADSTRSVSCVTTAISGELLVTAYQCSDVATGTTVYVQVENVETGAKVLPARVFNNGVSYPRVLIEGTTAYLVTTNSGGQVIVNTLDLATMIVSPTDIVIASNARVATCALMDAVIGDTAGGRTMFFAYGNVAGTGIAVHSALLASLATPLATGTIATVSVPTAICVAADSVTFHVGWSVVASTAYTTMTVNLTGIASTVVEAVESQSVFLAVFDATRVVFGYVKNSVSSSNMNFLVTHLRTVSTRAEVASTSRTTSHLMMPTKPWTVGGRWYVLATVLPRSTIAADTVPNASSVVIEIETAYDTASTNSVHPHSATAENQTGWFTPVAGYLAQVCVSGSTVYVPAAYRNREPTAYRAVPIGWNLHRIEAMTGDVGRCAPIGASALVAAGAPLWFDGGAPSPYGFVHAPLIRTATATAGGSQAAGTYFYVAVYEWRDAQGVLHRSVPSPPLRGITAGANLSTTLEIATTDISPKQFPVEGGLNAANPVSIALYRTTAGGSVYYRLTYEPQSNVIFNVASVGSVTFVDTRSDTNIIGSLPAIVLATQAQPYTATGELDDVPPPSFIAVATHRGRLAGLDGSRRTVWLSKDQTEDAGVAPGFNEVLTLAFASDKTALASLGATLAVFGRDGIDLVHGPGPDATGAGVWDMQRVQTDVGCVNSRSVVTGPMGVTFESAKGIELLGTDLAVSWIGKPVEDDLAAYPVITSAALVAAEHEIRFTCTTADGASGIVLAWDYFHSIWFVRRYNDAAATAAANVAFVDATLIGGVYTMLTAGGQVYQETDAHKLDNGTDFVTRSVELAPMSPSTPMSWHRVKDLSVLGTSVTDHDLEVSIARDYATTYEQTKTFLAQSDATAIGPLERCRVTLMHQKCRSVTIRLRDLVPTAPGALGTGDGPIWEGLAFRVMTKDGPAKTSAGRQG